MGIQVEETEFEGRRWRVDENGNLWKEDMRVKNPNGKPHFVRVVGLRRVPVDIQTWYEWQINKEPEPDPEPPRELTEEERFMEFIKNRLDIRIELNKSPGWYGSSPTVDVKVSLVLKEGEEGHTYETTIATAEDSVSLSIS